MSIFTLAVKMAHLDPDVEKSKSSSRLTAVQNPYAKTTYNSNQLKVDNFNDSNKSNRISTAYKIRKTYYNFNLQHDTKTHINELSKKINFADYSEPHRKLLLKCRDNYNQFNNPDAVLGAGGDACSNLNKKGAKKGKADNLDINNNNILDPNDQRTISFLGAHSRFDRDSTESSWHFGISDRFSHAVSWLGSSNETRKYGTTKIPGNRESEARKTEKELASVCSKLTKKEIKKLGTDKCLIHPTSGFRILWDVITILPGLITFIVLPLEFAFDSEKSWKLEFASTVRQLYVIFDLWLILDIILNYNTGYFDKSTKIYVMNKSLVRVNYKKWTFPISDRNLDILAVIQWNVLYRCFLHILIFTRICEHSWLMANGFLDTKWFRYLHCLKMLRFIKFKNYTQRSIKIISKQMAGGVQVFSFIKLFFLIFTVIHMSGLFQWIVPKSEEFPMDSWPVVNNLKPKQEIVYDSEFAQRMLSGKIYNDNHASSDMIELQGPLEYGKQWIEKRVQDSDEIVWETELKEASWYEKWWWCNLKATSQMLTLAYGGAPRTEMEVLMILLTIIAGAISWGLLIAVIINYLQTLHVNEDLYTMKMREVVSYANFKNLPAISKQLIFKFFEMRWCGKVFCEEEILEAISPTLRRRVLMHSRLPWIKNAPIFRNCSIQFLLEICYTMRDELYMTNQLVVSAGRICEQILIPYQGDLLQYIPKLDIMEVLQPGVILGETSIINREFWNGEVYSLGWTRAYTLRF